MMWVIARAGKRSCAGLIVRSRRFGRLFSTYEHPSIGFIGLGNMGLHMVKNLLVQEQAQGVSSGKHRSRAKVFIYDVNPAAVDRVVSLQLGAHPVESTAALAQSCSTIITMLPQTSHVQAVLTNPDEGVLSHCATGSLIIDCSTIDPLASAALSKQAEAKGVHMIDAPVSGGVTGAAAGSLTFMVGGSTTALAKAEPILRTMGKNIIHCGPAGSGGVAKLCNNLSLAISMIGVCEAMALVRYSPACRLTHQLVFYQFIYKSLFLFILLCLQGKSLGMDLSKLASVMNTSTAR